MVAARAVRLPFTSQLRWRTVADADLEAGKGTSNQSASGPMRACRQEKEGHCGDGLAEDLQRVVPRRVQAQEACRARVVLRDRSGRRGRRGVMAGELRCRGVSSRRSGAVTSAGDGHVPRSCAVPGRRGRKTDAASCSRGRGFPGRDPSSLRLHSIDTQSAALAFYSLFALAPVLLVILSIARALLRRRAGPREIARQLQASWVPSRDRRRGVLESRPGRDRESGLRRRRWGRGARPRRHRRLRLQLQEALNRVWKSLHDRDRRSTHS